MSCLHFGSLLVAGIVVVPLLLNLAKAAIRSDYEGWKPKGPNPENMQRPGGAQKA